MDAPLAGNAQFIVVSITFLTTLNLVPHLNRLQAAFSKQKKEDIPRRAMCIWRLTLIGGWLLTISALLGVARIFFASFSPESFLVLFDFIILSVMAGGYLSIAFVAWRSWNLSSWPALFDKAVPGLQEQLTALREMVARNSTDIESIKQKLQQLERTPQG